jgi:thiol-disulfide isomerase/thioredoxin
MRTTIVSLLGATVLFTGSATEPARPGPAFSIMRIGTAPLKLSQYRGKVVALAFIYTTCPHCQRLTAILNSVAKDYSARGVQVLECAFNEDAVPTMPDFLKQTGPQVPVGFAPRASVLSYLQYPAADPRLVYVPHLVFLDRAGTIRGDYPGEGSFFLDPDANIRKELDQMLKRSGATVRRSASPDSRVRH